MAKPTNAQKNGARPLDALFVQATGNATRGHEAHWEESDDMSCIGRALESLETHGGALLFGRTRDGGQLTVRVYGIDKNPTYYFDTQDKALAFVAGIAEIGGAL